jgi:hypothetical protein
MAVARDRCAALRAESQARLDACISYAENKSGFSREQAREEGLEGPKWRVFEAAGDEWRKLNPDNDPENEIWAKASDEAFRLSEEVLRRQPRSAADAAIQIQAFALLNNYLEAMECTLWRHVRQLTDALYVLRH